MLEDGSLLDRPVSNEAEGDKTGGQGRGCAVVGWFLLVLAVGLTGYFSYRVWFYTDAIEKGNLSLPPTLTFQSTRTGLPSLAAETVDRAWVEDQSRPSQGPDDAAVTVVVFADVICPFCQTEAPIYRRLMATYGDRIRFIYRHFPIEDMHPGSVQSAEAAECAFEQGKFWPYHDKLYFSGGVLTTDTLTRYAEQAGLDTVQFERCLSDRRYRDRVEADIAAGKRAGVSGTPTFFFNGQRVEGAVPEDIFIGIFDFLLQPSS